MSESVSTLEDVDLSDLDFDIPCIRADVHRVASKTAHKGSDKATHYVSGKCENCNWVSPEPTPVCKSFVDALYSDTKMTWVHRSCGHKNISQDTVQVVGTI